MLLSWAGPPRRIYNTLSYVEFHNNNARKRKRLQLSIRMHAQVEAHVPAVPTGLFQRAVKETELRDRFMGMLCRLGGEMQVKHDNRKTVCYHGVEFVDTHTLSYLDGTAPDISIICAGD